MRTPSGYLRLADVQRQVAQICGRGGVGISLVDMPQQIRELKDDGDETRRLMRTLYRELVVELTLAVERMNRPRTSRRRRKRSKKA